MLDKVHNYIEEHKMLNKGDRIVIGVSGGADSVCLFHVLYDMKIMYDLQLYVVHVNHGIRMEEAERDEEYVREMCCRFGVPFKGIKVDIIAMCKEQGVSEEEAGRNVRYEAFYQCLDEYNCNKIAIAHNKNDNAETILFNLFRGSGLLGLSGIKPKRNEIIRPLLGIERAQIEHYLKEKEVSYCLDYTNDTDDYSRNKIRHHILPYASNYINCKAVSHIVNSANQIFEAQSYIEKKINEAFETLVEYNRLDIYKFNISKFIKEDIIIQRGILRQILYRIGHSLKDVEFIHVENILSLQNKQVGKLIHLPGGIIAKREYTSIVITKDAGTSNYMEEEFQPCEVLLDLYSCPYFCMELPGKGKTLEMKLLKWEKNMRIPQNGYTKWFDYDKIKNTVFIRTRAEGDYIHIDDRGNKKKLKSFFIDQKIPKEERNKKLLIADGSHILWILGERNSEGYKINEETRVILEININGGNE